MENNMRIKSIQWVIVLLLLMGCSGGGDVVPKELDWNHDADALIVRVTVGGGMQPEAAYRNEIPRASLWGDGRYVWQTTDSDNARFVWQTQLDEAEMADLLQTFIDKGFFDLDSSYEPSEQVFDSSSTGLQLNLLAEQKSVSEYHDSAPREFHELVNIMSSGAGAEGQPYVPEIGMVTAVFLDQTDTTNLPVWDTAVLGLNLDDVYETWLEGDALARAWEIVNGRYWSPRVVQGEDVYELYVRLPDFTGDVPPAMADPVEESAETVEEVKETVEEVEEMTVIATQVATATVTISASDGLPLQATYLVPAANGLRPAVILLHMLGSNREAWQSTGLVQALVADGYHVLALDMRGHGETGGENDWPLAEDDLQRVWAWLIEQEGVDEGKTAVIGGSIGSNMALRTGANIETINTVVLLSPGLDYFGVTTEDALEQWGKRPLLIVASEEDSYAADSSRTLAAQAQGEAQLQMYSTAGHGTNMFNTEPDLVTLIGEWLSQHFK